MNQLIYLLTEFVFTIVALPVAVLSGAFMLLMLELGFLSFYYSAKTAEQLIKAKRRLLSDEGDEGDEVDPDDPRDNAQSGSEKKKGIMDKANSADPKRQFDLLSLSQLVLEKTAVYMKPTLMGLSSIIGILFVVFLIINQFFLGAVVLRELNSAVIGTGASYSFESFEGNLLTGKMRLKNLTVLKRSNHETAYKIKVGDIRMQIQFKSLFVPPIKISHINIAHVTGKVRYRTRDVSNHLLREFIIELMRVENIDVSFNLPIQAQQFQLKIDSVESQQVRSQYALFDVLLHSKMNGSLDGAEASFSSEQGSTPGSIVWKFDHFPAATFAKIIQVAPMNWFSRGSMSLRATLATSAKEPARYKSLWSMQMEGLKTVLPENLPPFRVNMYQPIIRHVNESQGEYDIKFKLEINEQDYVFSNTAGMTPLWDKVGRALIDKLKPQNYNMF